MWENENKHISNDKQIKQNEDKTLTKAYFDFRKLEYKAHVDNIAHKVVASEENLGKDNPITCMLKHFYDLQYCLLGLLEMISFDQKIAYFLTETMDIVDDAYKYIEYVYDVELQIHGKCKLKTKMEIRKYTRIIQKRMSRTKLPPIPKRKPLTGDVSNYEKLGQELIRVGWNNCLDEMGL